MFNVRQVHINISSTIRIHIFYHYVQRIKYVTYFLISPRNLGTYVQIDNI